MKIDLELLEKQIAYLSEQLNMYEQPEKDIQHIEGLLNMLGDIADNLKQNGETKLISINS